MCAHRMPDDGFSRIATCVVTHAHTIREQAKLQFNSSVCIDSTMEWVLQTFWLRRKLHFSSVSKIVTNVTSLFEMVRARRQNPNLQELTASNMYNVRDELRKDKQNVPRDWKLLWRSGT